MILLGCRWISSSETSMLTPKLFGWISCVHCLVICGNCTTPKDVSKNRLWNRPQRGWCRPPDTVSRGVAEMGRQHGCKGGNFAWTKHHLPRQMLQRAMGPNHKVKKHNFGPVNSPPPAVLTGSRPGFSNWQTLPSANLHTLLQHARAWKNTNAATTECLQSGAPSCHRQMTSLTWWKTFPQEPWCTSTTRAAWWQCARVRNSYLQFNTLMHGDERELLPEALRCVPPDCIWCSNFSNKANCGQEVITSPLYSKLVNVVEGFASTNGQWSMPAHHKARPFWTQAVKKQLDYVH